MKRFYFVFLILLSISLMINPLEAMEVMAGGEQGNPTENRDGCGACQHAAVNNSGINPDANDKLDSSADKTGTTRQ